MQTKQMSWHYAWQICQSVNIGASHSYSTIYHPLGKLALGEAIYHKQNSWCST